MQPLFKEFFDENDFNYLLNSASKIVLPGNKTQLLMDIQKINRLAIIK